MELIFSWLVSTVVICTTMLARTAAAEDPPVVSEIKPLAVTVSSHLPPWKGFTFDAKNLHDGRVDTSWQPAKSDLLGVGQWIEVDLGGYYAIDRVEIAQGLQLMHPKLGDLFCRNNRMSSAILFIDDGSTTWIPFDGGELQVNVSDFYRSESRGAKFREVATKAVGRRLMLVVQTTWEPVDWTDLAVAEIRVFGSPVTATNSRPKTVRCEGPGSYELKTAILRYCSQLDSVGFEYALCPYLWSSLSKCRAQNGPGFNVGECVLPMPPQADIDKGDVIWDIWKMRQRSRFRLLRDPDGKWRVTEHLLTDEANVVVPASNRRFEPTYGDEAQYNPCWDRLNKKRPPVEESGHSCDNEGDSEDHDDEDKGPEAAPTKPTPTGK